MNQNNKPYVIVITGGIATGKSEASGYIKKLGFTLVDSDKIVHEGYQQRGELYCSLINEFGEAILDNNLLIDRQRLGKIVLNNNDKLQRLNDIVHKYVIDRLKYEISICKEKTIFLDIPLMFEQKEKLTRLGLYYDEIWLVYVCKKTQIARLTNRAALENKNIEQALSIINKQMSIDDKKALADKIIYNEGTIIDLHNEINRLIDTINN